MSYYLDDEVVGTGVIGQYQKALAAIRVQNPELAIEILKKHEKKHRHPWLRLALAEAYSSNHDDN